jgi:fucose permease
MLQAVSRRATAVSLALASLGFVSLGLPEGLLGVAWPSIRATFDLPLDALGLLFTTFAGGYFLASAVNGRVLARAGVGTVLSASCALTGLCLLGYSLSPLWLGMVGLAAFVGAGGGTIDAALNVYATQHGARVLNWMHAAFGLGAAIGPLIMTTVLSSGASWSVGYALVGLAQLGLAIGYGVMRDRFNTATVHIESSARSGFKALLSLPQAWVSIALFFVYVGMEVTAGQWTFSLFTGARGLDTVTAGVMISTYWGSLTVGRIVFGVLVSHVKVDQLLRGCMAIALLASVVLWLNVPLLSLLALAVIGLMEAPIFPSLIALNPERMGPQHTSDIVGLQVAAAVLGGASIPAVVGLLAARLGLEVIGPLIVGTAVLLFVLHELSIRLAYGQRRSARSRTDAAVSSQPCA